MRQFLERDSPLNRVNRFGLMPKRMAKPSAPSATSFRWPRHERVESVGGWGLRFRMRVLSATRRNIQTGPDYYLGTSAAG